MVVAVSFSFCIIMLWKMTIFSCKTLIQVGDKLPTVDLYENSPTNKVNLAKIAEGKKIVVFAVPGAFTPGCSAVSESSHF